MITLTYLRIWFRIWLALQAFKLISPYRYLIVWLPGLRKSRHDGHTIRKRSCRYSNPLTTFSIVLCTLAIYNRLSTTACLLLSSLSLPHTSLHHLLLASYLSRIQIFASVESFLPSSVFIRFVEQCDFVKCSSFVKSPSFVENL